MQKMRGIGVAEPAANLYLCRSWNSKVKETAENAKNRRRRGCGRRQKIYIYVEAGMAKLKKQPKMQKNWTVGRRQKLRGPP